MFFRIVGLAAGGGGKLFRSLVSWPAMADLSSSPFLAARMADVLSTRMIRLGEWSGRWILRLLQCLASGGEEGGGSLRAPAAGWPVLRRYQFLEGVRALSVISFLSRVLFAKGWGCVCKLTVSSY